MLSFGLYSDLIFLSINSFPCIVPRSLLNSRGPLFGQTYTKEIGDQSSLLNIYLQAESLKLAILQS